jgi:basic amino acid/polyamine antiporter, APA family
VAEEVGLRRALGLRTVVSTSTGLAFAALEYLAIAGLIAYAAGDLAWISVAVAGLLALVAWGFYGELNGLYPTAAAVRRYMARSMDDRIALTVTFTYLSAIVLVIAADAFIVGSAIAHVLGQPNWLVAVYIGLLIALAAAANLKGLVVAGAVQDVATFIIVVTTAVIGVVAIAHHPTAAAHLAAQHRHHGVGAFVQAVALGVFLYGGFEWVTTSAEEVRTPGLVPQGMLISVFILFVSCALATEGMIHLLGQSELNSAYPQLFLGRHAAGEFGYGLMCAITALTALNTFNGGFITASRFIYATAREGSLPPGFARLNANFVPWVPVVALATTSLVVGVVVALTESWQVLVAVGAALEAMIYVVAGLCVIKLRDREPDSVRPFRLRAGKPLAWGGMAVFAILSVGASVSVNNRFNPLPLAIIVVMAGLSAGYVIVYMPKLQAAEAMATTKRRRPPPAPQVG